jgi:hypothetical protein
VRPVSVELGWACPSRLETFGLGLSPEKILLRSQSSLYLSAIFLSRFSINFFG